MCCFWVLITPLFQYKLASHGPSAQFSSSESFERNEEVLQHHKALMASASAQAKHVAATQEQALSSLATQVQQLTSVIAQLASHNSASAPAIPTSPSPRPASEPRIGAPVHYAGEPEGCIPFLTSFSIYSALQSITFIFEEAKVAFTINQLTGRVRPWGTAEWDRRTPACVSFKTFSAELCKVFGQGVQSVDAGGHLSLSQGNQSVLDFSIDFRTKSWLSLWNEGAFHDAFLHGLADNIQDDLVSYALLSSLDGVIELAINIDLHI